MADILPPRPNYSEARRRTAISWIRGELLGSEVTEEAKVLAAVSLLICDDHGVLRRRDLDAAVQDPSIVQAAQSLLAEAVV